MATFTLEYWVDEDWYVGRLKEVPGVFSQGETLADLKENLRDAYHMLKEDQQPTRAQIRARGRSDDS